MFMTKPTLITTLEKIEHGLELIDRRLIPIVWMAVIFYLSSMPDLSLKGSLATYDFILRKLGHIGIYALLAIFVGLNTKRWWLVFVICLVYAISDELHQTVVPGRIGSIQDVFIDTVGILIGIFIYRWTIAYRKKHVSSSE